MIKKIASVLDCGLFGPVLSCLINLALSDATADTLYQAYRSSPTYFTYRGHSIRNLQDFRDTYSVALRDFNTAGVVSAHLGRPLSQLNGGHHLVHGHSIQVNGERVAECQRAVDSLIGMI